MIPDCVERNLLTFLAPSSRRGEKGWHFARTGAPSGEAASGNEPARQGTPLIYGFSRRDLPHYFAYALALRISRPRGKIRKILFINDGLLSCFFDAGKAACYRAFARRHLAAPRGASRWLAMLLPATLRAEQRFLVIDDDADATGPCRNDALGGLDFMFYSNGDGKLMLTRAETFRTGSGQLLKTSSSPDYVSNLERESGIIGALQDLTKDPGSLPRVGKRISVNGQHFFPEEYLCGENLREVLRAMGRDNSYRGACLVLDRLDAWHATFHSTFSGEKKPLAFFYTPVVQSFIDSHIANRETLALLRSIRDVLETLGKEQAGLVPVIAHNDLWPGNFIIQKGRVRVVDWERATEQSAPLFDYYWMMISAAIEYRVGINGNQDYAVSFRQFLDAKDEVCRQVHEKLGTFIEALGFDRKRHRAFIMLFLMEWSVQGYRALGRQTDMDRLAFGELIAFARDHENPAESRPAS